MKLPELENIRELDQNTAKKELVTLLQNAHAGEKAAANAYYGHAYSLFVTDKQEKSEILQIYKDELHHRRILYELLGQVSAKPRVFREIQMFLVGFCIGFLCLFGGWFIPMYGAGKLERDNIVEYEVAARLALVAGFIDMVDTLIAFGEVEWDHELYFREKAASHFLSRFVPIWEAPAPRERIRQSFEEFAKHVAK